MSGPPGSPRPQAAGQLPALLDIEWSAGPPLPRGMQDNDGGIVDGWLVAAGGFCGGYESDVEPVKYRRGFLRDVYGLDLRDPAANETGGFEYAGRYYGHHPEFVLRGQLRLADAGGADGPGGA